MSRLIDADKLIEKLKGHSRGLNCEFNSACRIIIEVVKEQPTAYDVDKVVKELEELRDKANLNVLKNMNEPIPYSSASNRAYAYDMAIEVVKAGGLNASKRNS